MAEGFIPMKCIFALDMPEQKFLGFRPDLLDSTRYSWGAVKLPKCKSWKNDFVFSYRTRKGEEIYSFHDKEYAFSSIRLFNNAPDLYLKFIPGRGRNFEYRYVESEGDICLVFFKQSALYLTIKNYAELLAFDVINDFRNSETGECIGRHFEEAILTFWHSKQLPLW